MPKRGAKPIKREATERFKPLMYDINITRWLGDSSVLKGIPVEELQNTLGLRLFATEYYRAWLKRSEATYKERIVAGGADVADQIYHLKRLRAIDAALGKIVFHLQFFQTLLNEDPNCGKRRKVIAELRTTTAHLRKNA